MTPVYSETTGRLEAIESDSNGDGAIDTRAFMDGPVLRHIEIDRDHDGHFERREYYVADVTNPNAEPVMERAEEIDADGLLLRVEHYAAGRLDRVEEDLNHDGLMDKWEVYEAGVLSRLDLDLSGRGRPERRLYYGPAGNVDRIEADPDGDGVFTAEESGQP